MTNCPVLQGRYLVKEDFPLLYLSAGIQVKGRALVCCLVMHSCVKVSKFAIERERADATAGRMIFSFFCRRLTKHFGGLLLQKMQREREDPRLFRQYKAEPGLPPSLFLPAQAAASWAIKASGERARGDPSSCEAAPAREAARPRCHRPAVSCPRSPAAGFRHRSLNQKELFMGTEGKASRQQAQNGSPRCQISSAWQNPALTLNAGLLGDLLPRCMSWWQGWDCSSRYGTVTQHRNFPSLSCPLASRAMGGPHR